MRNDLFKTRLAELLDKRKMKPYDLSLKTGISRGAISKYLSGKVNPKQDKIYIISQALGVNPLYLWGISDDMTNYADSKERIIGKLNCLDEKKLIKVEKFIDEFILKDN